MLVACRGLFVMVQNNFRLGMHRSMCEILLCLGESTHRSVHLGYYRPCFWFAFRVAMLVGGFFRSICRRSKLTACDLPVASRTSALAHSFPWMFTWPGTHSTWIHICGCAWQSACMWISFTRCCPGCLGQFIRAVMVAWLSMAISAVFACVWILAQQAEFR